MAFDDPQFLFGFIPCVVIACAILRAHAPDFVAPALLLASLVFYLASDPAGAIFVFPLVLVTVGTIEGMTRRPKLAKAIAAFGVLANVAVLVVWKYAPDAIASPQPLGLSFVTFLNVSAIVDVYAGRAEKLPVTRQSLYSGFFASVSAGPVTRFGDLSHQLRELGHAHVSKDDILLGLALCVMGLGKAVIIGRPLLIKVGEMSLAVSAGDNIAFIEAWYVALSSLTGLYFVFSGYSDMAIGLGLAVGLKLAINFNSPLKSKDGADFFLRWHISLSKWIEVYVFSPLTRMISRLRFGKAKTRRVLAWSVGTIVSTTLFAAWHGTTLVLALTGLIVGVWIVLMRLPDLIWKRPRPVDVSLVRRIRGRIVFLAFTSVIAFAYTASSSSVTLAIGRELINPLEMSLSAPLVQSLPFASTIGLRADGLFPLMKGVKAYWVCHLAFALALALTAPNSMEIFGLIESRTRILAERHKGLLAGIIMGAMAGLAMGMLNMGGGFVYEDF